MMEYIDSKMSKDDVKKKEERQLSAEDELYLIPENMVGSTITRVHLFAGFILCSCWCVCV